MPNGYDPAMIVFKKLLKAPFSSVSKRRYPSVAFVDDTYLQGEDFKVMRRPIFCIDISTHSDRK